MKVHIENIGGEVVKKASNYTLIDNTYLEHLTFSQTVLNPGYSTNGHSHENQEEVYIFTDGEGIMQIDETRYDAKPGDTFLIKAGQFHRVFNLSMENHCKFTCIFEKYDRAGTEAKY